MSHHPYHALISASSEYSVHVLTVDWPWDLVTTLLLTSIYNVIASKSAQTLLEKRSLGNKYESNLHIWVYIGPASKQDQIKYIYLYK